MHSDAELCLISKSEVSKDSKMRRKARKALQLGGVVRLLSLRRVQPATVPRSFREESCA